MYELYTILIVFQDSTHHYKILWCHILMQFCFLLSGTVCKQIPCIILQFHFTTSVSSFKATILRPVKHTLPIVIKGSNGQHSPTEANNVFGTVKHCKVHQHGPSYDFHCNCQNKCTFAYLEVKTAYAAKGSIVFHVVDITFGNLVN